MGRSITWSQRGIFNNTHKHFQYVSTPKDIDNNVNIANFTGMLTLIITDPSKGCNTCLAVGDFNIHLYN